jgi:hypothetical protein
LVPQEFSFSVFALQTKPSGSASQWVMQAFGVTAAVTYPLVLYKPVCTVSLFSLDIFIDEKIGYW